VWQVFIKLPTIFLKFLWDGSGLKLIVFHVLFRFQMLDVQQTPKSEDWYLDVV